MAVVAFTGRLLPTWMFINQLQLLLHTQLFTTYMPAKTAYFFSQMLDFPRFNILPESDWYFKNYAPAGEISHNFNFKYYGYRSVNLM